MTIGRNSIAIVITVPNLENPKEPHKVTVQANKNFGICDMSPRVGEILTDFQGQQLVYHDGIKFRTNSNVTGKLKTALTEALNPNKQ